MHTALTYGLRQHPPARTPSIQLHSRDARALALRSTSISPNIRTTAAATCSPWLLQHRLGGGGRGGGRGPCHLCRPHLIH